MTPQETDPDLPVSVQESLVEAWVGGGLLSVGHWVWQCVYGTFWRGRHCPHYLHHSLVSGQTTRREHNPAHQQKIGLKIYWAQPHASEQDLVSPTVSLSHQETSISLLSLSLIGQTEWKLQSQKPMHLKGPKRILAFHRQYEKTKNRNEKKRERNHLVFYYLKKAPINILPVEEIWWRSYWECLVSFW